MPNPDWMKQRAKAAAQSVLRGRGVEMRRLEDLPPVEAPGPPPQMVEFWARAQEIEQRHNAQTVETVAALQEKYWDEPVFGDVRVWDLVLLLARCVDPSDGRLFGASQLIHVLQMLDGMARDGIDDPELLIAALVHDLGKLLLLTREDPANVVCMTAPIGSYANGVGLDAVTLQWNHDEFGYSRLGEHVSEPVAWLVRYHSILPECMPLMNGRDFAFKKKYLDVFAYYDHETKSAFRLPEARIETYRDLIEDAFPKPILF